MKLWQKNKTQSQSEINQKVNAFTVGNDFLLDSTLLPFDIKGSKAHVKALMGAGILSPCEAESLIDGLDEILSLWQKGLFEILPEHEDMHTAIELWLTEKLGDLGKKIHTGRSRNDQVLTAIRLYELEKLDHVKQIGKSLAATLLDFAEKYEKTPMPGYTHTRKAMLSSVGQWSAGYAELLLIQLSNFSSMKSLISRSPLGTAAGFGSSIDLDREKTANELGFDDTLVVATSAQLSRGWMEWQLASWLAGITGLISRLCADIIRYSSEAYGYFVLDEMVCTGSSIMPQKKNPDVAELIRARHSIVLGELTKLQSLTQNLESGYHRDLQLTKEPIMIVLSNTLEVLEITTILIQSLSINEDQLAKACTPELFAAEYANLLVVEKGISFREAYMLVKENPEITAGLDPKIMMKKYTQLGSPGNVGLEKLKMILETP